LKLVTVDPRTSPLWEQLVSALPSSLFHSPPWLRSLSHTYDFCPRASVLMSNDHPVAGLPFVEVNDFIGARIRVLPFSDFCDPLFTSADQWPLLIASLLATGQRIDLRCMQTDAARMDQHFNLVHEALWHGVSLQCDQDRLWGRLRSSARRNIRKARAAGMVVHQAETEQDLRAFHRLHVGVRKRKYSLLAQPYSFLRGLWTEFLEPGAGRLLFAALDGEIVAGSLFLDWKGATYYKLGASNPDYLPLRPNDLILWTEIVGAASRGSHLLDLGLSEPSQEGLVRYKRKYATSEKVVSFLRHEPNAVTASEREARRLLDKITELFVDDAVPDTVTERAGAMLYRYFV